MAMPAVTKNATLRAAKRAFDQLRRLAPAPPVHILRLPHAPSDLLRDHPAIYKAAFGDKSPVPLQGPAPLHNGRGLEEYPSHA